MPRPTGPRHHIAWAGQHWKCDRCGQRKVKGRGQGTIRPCRQMNPKLEGVIAEPQGHVVFWGDKATGGVLFCGRCWAYATTTPKALCEPCQGVEALHGVGKAKGVAASRRQVRRQIGKMLCPLDGSRLAAVVRATAWVPPPAPSGAEGSLELASLPHGAGTEAGREQREACPSSQGAGGGGSDWDHWLDLEREWGLDDSDSSTLLDEWIQVLGAWF